MTDGQTTFHLIPYIGINASQTDRHFILSLILDSMYDRRTDISFHTSYWDLLNTDGQTFHFVLSLLDSTYDRKTDISFHFITHIRFHVWQTDRHFISHLILGSTSHRPTDNISFHSSYWNPSMTDGQTFHFIPYIGIHVWQTDRQHFILSLILESTYDRRTDMSFHFIPHIGFHVWQTDRHFIPHIRIYFTQTDRQHFISILILESTYDRQTDSISFHSSYWNPRMTDGQTFHFIPHIGFHVWETDRHFISYLIFGSTSWQTDRHFISSLILESMYDRRTDISFYFSFLNPCTIDGQTIHFIPHIGIHVWQTDRHFISFLILESMYDRRTDNISFYSSYWNPRMTDGQTFHFIPHIGIHVWQTDRHFIPYIGIHVWQTDRQHFIPHIGIHVWQTDRHFISFLIFESMYERRTDNISFHTLYWNPCMTDGQTFHFIPHIGIHVWQTDRHFISHIWIHVWQTDRQHFILYLMLESMYDRRTDNISFHTSYWNPRMTDGQTTFHFIPHIWIHVWHTDRHFISYLILGSTSHRRTDISFHFITDIRFHVWQTDRHFISHLILGSTSHRPTDNISFHSSYWNPCMTDGQTTFHFIPYIGIHVWQTDRQHFISILILESTYDRRTDISFHSSYWIPCMTDGQTFHFIPHIRIYFTQTDRQHFISSLILESTYDRRTDNISLHFSYLNPCMTDWQTFHFIPYIGIHV